MKQDPYEKFKNYSVWGVLEKAIEDLVNNDDMEEKTERSYIIKYIIKCLDENNCLSTEWSNHKRWIE